MGVVYDKMAASVNGDVEEEACSSNKKRWTDSRTVLISILKEYPCLYNTTLKEYKNRDQRKKAMEDTSRLTGLCS